MSRKPVHAEIHAYGFILNMLQNLGWQRTQIYSQHECLQHPRIKECLVREHPENIVKVDANVLYVIEAKPRRSEVKKALDQANERAVKINSHPKRGRINVKLISGVGGNPETGYDVWNRYVGPNGLEEITENGVPLTTLVPAGLADQILKFGPTIQTYVPDAKLMRAVAEEIRLILHEADVNPNEMAKIIGALLLAEIQEPIDTQLTLPEMVAQIHERVRSQLKLAGKVDFAKYIQLEVPTDAGLQEERREAIVATITALERIDLKLAMGSETDVLGEFYETFLHYGEGPQKQGVVLTPRNATQFAAYTVAITDSDVVYDPCCGTGGFLVAAYDQARRTLTETQLERFRIQNIFGVEKRGELATLSIINMMFRGDGHANIIGASCFETNVALSGKTTPPFAFVAGEPEQGQAAITKVLMNPPFKPKQGGIPEYQFIDQAMKSVRDGGILFSVLPYSCMCKDEAGSLFWRKSILQHHTLLCVVSFPGHLFAPRGTKTVGLYIKKGHPHKPTQKVLWIRTEEDGWRVSKNRRVIAPERPNHLEEIKDLVRSYIITPSMRVESVARRQAATIVDVKDDLVELVPEYYLPQDQPSPAALQAQVDRMARENAILSLRMSDLWDGNDEG